MALIARLSVLVFMMVISMNIHVYAQQVEVVVTHIRSSKGSIQIGLFKDAKSFKDEKPYKIVNYPKTNFQKGTVSLKLDMPPGVHGISLIDDENNNKELDYNMIRMPKEGFGFSDYYHTGFTKPTFDDFKFTLSDGETKKVVVKMRYM